MIILKNYCCVCGAGNPIEVVFSDGLSGSEIKTYCISCFYKLAIEGFNKIKLTCECGEKIILLNGETIDTFKKHFTYKKLEYICHSKVENELGNKEHTHLLIPICREKSKIEERMVECYFKFKSLYEKVAALKSNRTSPIDESFYEHQQEAFSSLLELEILRGIVEGNVMVDDEIVNILSENPVELEKIEGMGVIVASALGKALKDF